MAGFTTILLGIGLGLGAIGTYQSMKETREARRQAEAAARRQESVRSEQAAGNAREAAMANRERIREERVRRAQIMAAAENTGTSNSSVEMGALGGMATQFGSASGASGGMFMMGQRISLLQQQASDLMASSNSHQARSGFMGQVGNLGWSLASYASQQTKANQKAQSQLYGLGGSSGLGLKGGW